MAAATVVVPSRSVGLFADLVEAEARRNADRRRPEAEEDQLVRAFRGGATPAESVGQFLDRIYHAGWVEETCFVLAGVYLTRFLRSRAAIEAGIRVDPATAHRLAAVALYVGTKFGGHPHQGWTAVFEVCSGHTIRAAEMIALERLFLRAIDYRLYVRSELYDSFFRFMVAGPPLPLELAPPPPAPEPVAPYHRCDRKRKGVGEEEDKHHRARRVRPCLSTTADAAAPIIAPN